MYNQVPHSSTASKHRQSECPDVSETREGLSILAGEDIDRLPDQCLSIFQGWNGENVLS